MNTMESTTTTSSPGTQAIRRAISLLKSFSDNQPEWHLNDLADANGLNRTTAYRLMNTLENEGLVIRHRDSRLYSLGPELIALGGCAMRSYDLRTLTRPYLQELAKTTGEAATLEVLAGRYGIVIDETSGQHLVGVSQDVGARLPLHATSTGKVLLAYAEPEKVSAVLSSPFAKLTPHTVDSPDLLQAQIQQIRQRGYAVTVNELEIGFVAIAAPIFDHDNRVIAAVSIGGPSARLTPSRVEEAIDIVVQAAKDISRRLGHRTSLLAIEEGSAVS